MSELKRFDIVGKYADEETVYEFRPDGECYDADEVDKVIAEKDLKIKELEENHKKEVEQLLILNRKQSISTNRLRDSMEQVIRHQKYKRCLAMAEMCMFKSRISYFEKKINKTRLMSKWRNRWFELAETFKEAK